MSERMAMIEEVGVGARDIGRPVLWFTVSGEGWGALQVFALDDPVAVTLMSSVHEVHELNGRTCIVESDQDIGGTVKFSRLMRPARVRA